MPCAVLYFFFFKQKTAYEIGSFKGTHVPHVFDLTPALKPKGNQLRIIFDLPPRWLGQFGFTSQMHDWKPRFNYTWDWQPRLVQIGIWDAIHLIESDGQEIERFQAWGDAEPGAGTGILRARGKAPPASRIRITLRYSTYVIRKEELDAKTFNAVGVLWNGLPVDLWWPNLMG